MSKLLVVLICTANAAISNYYGIGGGVEPTYSYGYGSKTEGNYCSYTQECVSGLVCTPSVNGYKICYRQQNSNYPGIGNGVQPNFDNNNNNQGREGSYCNTNQDCAYGLSCVPSANGYRICYRQQNSYYPGIGGGVEPNNNYNGGGGSKAEGSYCSTTQECAYGLQCTPAVNGVKICLSQQNIYDPNGGNTGYCGSGCPAGTVCENIGGVGRCQIQAGGNVGASNQGMLPVKSIIPLRCETESDCPNSNYLCVFSTAMQDRVCYRYGDVVTDGYVIPVKHTSTTPEPTTTTSDDDDGMFAESIARFQEEQKEIEDIHIVSKARSMKQNGVKTEIEKRESTPSPPTYMKMEDQVPDEVSINSTTTVSDEPIDPAATICEFDYHCRMGESCSGVVRFVDKVVHVCRYDILKKHRQCIYHSDCLSGQRCIPNPTKADQATCEVDVEATLGNVACIYDYQCSGGEKCTKVDEKFICRPPSTSDPRTNQLCTTNAQCPFQQVCRRSSGISMCIDVAMSKQPHLLQERVIQFMRNVLFRAL
ncbi:unnamed protein product [Caenorhabditis bovis]|uniref:EB domain-containing protein n=1 Tax=Caenorhabditis bovis TaxID=2654633 RepID=A0A8S1ELK8_9PELO|nr:unnamed protein product [Caenorhabditis bovis]